jgi:magnesium-transporting ATPase (P-type)
MIISVTLGSAIAFEIEEDGIMERPPRAASQPLIGKHILFRTFWLTTLFVIAIIGLFEWSLFQGNEVGQARAAAFTLLVTGSVFYALNCRSIHEFALGKSIVRPNRAFWISCVLVLGIQALIVHVDAINRFFSCESRDIADGHCHTMGGLEWGPIFGISAALFVLVSVAAPCALLLIFLCHIGPSHTNPTHSRSKSRKL